LLLNRKVLKTLKIFQLTMRITIFGAGSLGSFIGGILSTKHHVGLIGRQSHIHAIKKRGLRITGKTKLLTRPKTSLVDCQNPELLIFTVKAYDTQKALMDALPLMGPDTFVLSLQNGFLNEDLIADKIGKRKVIGGATSHGVTLIQPGEIKHTGKGDTVIGEMDGRVTPRIKKISSVFKEVGLKTRISKDIKKDLYIKTIVNAGINPITALFNCKNEALLTNPFLTSVLELTCKEAINILNANGINLPSDIINTVKKIAECTADNYSSMAQSIRFHKKTEIDQINGEIVKMAEKLGRPAPINRLLVSLVKALEYENAAVA
jgi:2-dehydropantoate 2-reductase